MKRGGAHKSWLKVFPNSFIISMVFGSVALMRASLPAKSHNRRLILARSSCYLARTVKYKGAFNFELFVHSERSACAQQKPLQNLAIAAGSFDT